MLEIFRVKEDDAVRVQADDLRRVVQAIFEAVGVEPSDAKLGADVLVTADVRGVDSHGVSNMLRTYVQRIRDGDVHARPDWQVIQENPSTATIDCDKGLGIMIAPKAMAMAIEKAKRTGIGAVAMRNANHSGMASYHAMLALPHDMIGMCLTAAGPQVLPTHGAVPRIGTNPIAVAVPAKTMHPFVFDAATSVVASNKLQLAKRLGTDIPGNFLATMDGTIISEPGPLPDQFQLLTMGGSRELGSHKGFALAMVIDIMCSVLAGAVPSGFSGRGPANHFVAAYNIAAFTDVDEFKERMDWYLREMEATPPAPGYDRVMTPGLEEAEMEVERNANGIPLHTEVVGWLEQICDELNIPKDYLEAPTPMP
jgi:LDH2 family malate/lactate/ureidoglycolate dehydrogenase